MRLYLDCNLYTRPFDDLTQSRIAKEARAFVRIVQSAIAGNIIVVSSDVLKLELGQITDLSKRGRVFDLLAICTEHVSQSEAVRQFAKGLETHAKVQGRDALHLASATIGEVDYFLSCDDRLLKKKGAITQVLSRASYRLTILNPVDFLSALERGGNE